MQRLTALSPLLLAFCAFTTTPVLADPASELHAQLKERWYTTELVVFRYTNPPSAESLQLTGERVTAAEYAKRLQNPGDPDTDAAFSVLTLGDSPEDVAREQRLAERPRLDAQAGTVLLDYSPGTDLDSVIAQNMATWESQLRELEGQTLTTEQLSLSSQAAKLSANRGIEVLLHTGWTQAVPARENGIPVPLTGGDAYVDPRNGDSLRRLEGEVTVTLGRYLHVQPTLYYTPVTTTETRPGSTRSQPPSGTPEVRDLSSRSALDRLRDRTAQNAANRDERNGRIDTRSSDFELDLPPYTRLEQSRRVRSGELHYIDHPELGVLVKVTPVEPPLLLQEQFSLLQ